MNLPPNPPFAPRPWIIWDTGRKTPSKKRPRERRSWLVVCIFLGGALSETLFAQSVAHPTTSYPASLPDISFHLTARPWQPVSAPESELLDQLDTAIHALAPLQFWNERDDKDVKNGAIIDPYNKAEVQYATPLFAFNVATLLAHDRAADLVTAGARALDRATLNISTGKANDSHGEFFAAAMVKALRIYQSLQARFPEITAERIATWKSRMSARRDAYMNMKVKQNWRTFAMKGEWLRQQDGYITDGTKWIEANWNEASEGGQRERFRADLDRYGMAPHFFLYHDRGADPETFAYNGATTANLLDMLENGYDGPSATEMREIVEYSLRSGLLLMGGSGEAAAGGRTGEHIWDDTVYAAGFEMMAEISHRNGAARRAGQFRRAAQLLFKSHARFQQERGWFSITKNQFHSSLKHRYAGWSALTNYNGYTLTCLAESILTRKTEIPEEATPVEIGGYAATLDPSFSNVFVNAGGMQAQICTRGETDNYGGVQWHTLGITRFSRTGWESRLGAGAGHTNPDFSDSISFAPVFRENGRWTRVSQQPKRFAGCFESKFVHPLLVRGVYTIQPLPGQTGPTFAMDLTLTPDGALVDTKCVSGAEEFGVIWPVLEFDGQTMLSTGTTDSIASTSFPSKSSKPTVLQSDDATLLGDITIASEQAGYRGNGYSLVTAAGGALEWREVDGGDGGPTTIGFRYSLGIGSKSEASAKLVINGVAQSDLMFLSTGKWDDWHQLYIPVTLEPGKVNVIRVEVGGENRALIDELRAHPAIARTPDPDEQNFIALRETHRLESGDPCVRGGYGDLRPVRVTDSGRKTVETFVYPRSAGDPSAATVRESFTRNGEDFASLLGRVDGTLYIGRTSAGGEGTSIDLDRDGHDEVTFDQRCAFILQIRHGRIVAIESDRDVAATVHGKPYTVTRHAPVKVE